MSRFDYVAFDDQSQKIQGDIKAVCQALESRLWDLHTADTKDNAAAHSFLRSRACAFTALEEFYMWVGKTVRDFQICRNGSAPLQEGRGNE